MEDAYHVEVALPASRSTGPEVSRDATTSGSAAMMMSRYVPKAAPRSRSEMQ